MFRQPSLVELCRTSWSPCRFEVQFQSYLRGCKWSPDGTCCLVVVNGQGVHAIELPRDLYDVTQIDKLRPINVLESAVEVAECGLIYDFAWYPLMSSSLPETCCWITTRRNAPLQLWDAFDGSLRCSYRGYNSVDELEPAISVCFSNEGDKIYAGYKKSIKIFHTDRPGRDYSHAKVPGSPASLAVSPVDSLIALGFWKKDIGFYDDRIEDSKLLGKACAHTGGVTHLKFSPDGMHLVSGARKDDRLVIWDIRQYDEPLKILHRKVETNQRIYFDISACGGFLVSGSTDGLVRVWNLQEEIQKTEIKTEQLYPLHTDCCNGVSIHPYRPILSTSSGQHHIVDTSELEIENDIYKIKEEILSDVKTNICFESDKDAKMDCDILCKLSDLVENSLEFWWTGDIND